MSIQNLSTPGVYINELNAFPNSVVGVATAVPAFIGYTPKAEYEGKSYINIPVKISSFSDFQAFFCYPDPQAPAPQAKQYSPEYYLVKLDEKPEKGASMLIENNFYAIVPDSYTVYYLYNSIKLFYENGGSDAYIVSVGTYGKPSGKPADSDKGLINPNVSLNDLLNGLSKLGNELEPTMYICPEATLLSLENNATIMQAMLLQASKLQTAMCIFDVINGDKPDPNLYTQDIQNFRTNVGNNGLNHGIVYYPFIGTTTMQNTDIDYTNFFGGDTKLLEAILSPISNPNPTVDTIFKNINDKSSIITVTQNNNALLIGSPIYASILKEILKIANILPPSGAMAGVITTTDNQVGPWQAPANTSIVGAVSLPIELTDSQQGSLNVDAVSGKSINAIRMFTGLGILVWGARTLDGNSQDFKYISTKRTLIYIEQSCKLATQAYVFQPNDANTWAAVKSMISSFLTSVWKEGGLQGASPADAFSVECGLGVTMAATDILYGILRVTIKIAIVHPAEFIVISFQQQMATS
jgi:uncharacterized protein